MNKKFFAVAAALAVVFTTIAPANALTIRPPRKQAASSTFECGNDLASMRRVYADQLWSVMDERDVWVNPICEGDRSLKGEGNVGTLAKVLKEQPVLISALWDAGYNPEDVVAIRMTGEGKVTLYVQHS